MSVFSPSGPSPISSVSIQGGVTPQIDNVVVSLANTEVAYLLPVNTKRFLIRNRDTATLKVAFTAGTSGTTFLTVYPGTIYKESDLQIPSGFYLYFQTTAASQTIEIVSWS